jgi:hypothetical protein
MSYSAPPASVTEPTIKSWTQILNTTITPVSGTPSAGARHILVTNDGMITIIDVNYNQYLLNSGGTIFVQGEAGVGAYGGIDYSAVTTLTGRYVAYNNFASGNVLEVYDKGSLIFSIPFTSLNAFLGRQGDTAIGISPNGKIIVLASYDATDSTQTRLRVIVYQASG